MENTIKRVIVMSMLLVGLMVHAKSEDPKPVTEVKSLNTEKLKLSITGVVNQATILIKDEYGFVIYFENMTVSKEFKKTYNISSLPSGVYYMEIISDEYSKEYLVKKEYEVLSVKVEFPSHTEGKKMLAVL